jgi:membrane protease YdiL (CAAX protease family)
MTKGKDFTKRHLLPIYFALVFILSWGVFFILFGRNGLPVPADQKVWFAMVGLFGPSVAGLGLIGLVSGRAGFRELRSRLLRWKVSARWYAVALLTAPLSTAVVLLAFGVFSPDYIPSIFTADGKAALILTGIFSGLLFGFFEELGWTGCAIPQLRRRYSIVATGLIVGLIWGLWHLPLFWERDSFTGPLPLALLLARLFSWLPAYRVLMVWVYDRTESLLVVMLMHVSLVFISVVINSPVTGGGQLTILLIRAAILWIFVAVVTFGSRKKLSRAEPVELPGVAS